MLNILSFFAEQVPVLSYVKIAIAALALIATGFIIFVVMQQKGNTDGMEAMTGSSKSDDETESYYGKNSASRREAKLKLGTYICSGVLAACCIAMIILSSIA